MQQSALFLFPMFLLGVNLAAMEEEQNLKIAQLEKQVETLIQVVRIQGELLENLVSSKIQENEMKEALQKNGQSLEKFFYIKVQDNDGHLQKRLLKSLEPVYLEKTEKNKQKIEAKQKDCEL